MLTLHRRVEVGDIEIETPATAIEIRRIREKEPVDPSARGVNELHRRVSGEDLTNGRRGSSSAIVDHYQRGCKKAREDELTLAFASYDETGELPLADAAYLVDVLDTFSDIITVPLMPRTAGSVDPETYDGIRDPAYQDYRNSVESVLEAVEKRAPDTPIMGTIPMLGWEYIEHLMDIYARHDIRAFCLNFNRRKITAERQVSIIRPFMQSISTRDIEDNILVYGINPDPTGTRDDALGFRPATDFASFGVGVDIVGGTHVSPKMPSSVFEEMGGDEEETEQTFRMFDRRDGCYRDVPLSDLPEVFPEDSALDGAQVAQRCREMSATTLNRLQKILNAEQKSFAAADVRSALTDDSAFEQMKSKTGIPPETIRSFEKVRDGFDDGRNQAGLSDF
jgi:hypothetical protein